MTFQLNPAFPYSPRKDIRRGWIQSHRLFNTRYIVRKVLQYIVVLRHFSDLPGFYRRIDFLHELRVDVPVRHDVVYHALECRSGCICACEED